MSSLSSSVTEVYYKRVDPRGKIPIPREFRKLLDVKNGSWVEMQFHVIDNMPALVCTKAENGKKK